MIVGILFILVILFIGLLAVTSAVSYCFAGNSAGVASQSGNFKMLGKILFGLFLFVVFNVLLGFVLLFAGASVYRMAADRPGRAGEQFHDEGPHQNPLINLVQNQSEDRTENRDPIDEAAAKLIDVIERETNGELPIKIPLPADQEKKIPDWLSSEGKVRTISDSDDEELQLVVIHSGFYTTPEEAERDAYLAVSDSFRKALNEEFAYHQPWELPEKAVREVAVRDSYLESELHDFGSAKAQMYRMHLLVDQSPEVRAELAPWLKEIIVGFRLFKWGAMFAVGFVFLCISTIVLKVLNRNRYAGSY